ncbi:MAG: cytochrome c biogenesis protein CcdA [Longimicrobiales bacterium]|nr:cytochrome c biogenesis protein CcdA [Longimicrobiales bacterium]
MQGIELNVGFGLAFVAGLLSFLSPCVLPVVPGYVTFVSGVTFDELSEGGTAATRRRAVIHSIAFGLGFGVVFMTLGATASAFGQALTQWLPIVTRVGGVVVILFALHLLGAFRAVGWLNRERRLHLARHPGGLVGSFLVGVAFGAGWSPCIGPVLGSILFFAGLEHTVVEATLMLGVYGLGLAIPFILAAVSFNWFISGVERFRSSLPWLERGAGVILLVLGILMVTGQFAALNLYLANLGQLVPLEIQ